MSWSHSTIVNVWSAKLISSSSVLCKYFFLCNVCYGYAFFSYSFPFLLLPCSIASLSYMTLIKCLDVVYVSIFNSHGVTGERYDREEEDDVHSDPFSENDEDLEGGEGNEDESRGEDINKPNSTPLLKVEPQNLL
jgi:hypothetical protein